MTNPPRGQPPVDLQTDRFRLRTLRPDDASERWAGWAKDPDIMNGLNAPVRDMSRQDLAKYAAGFDNRSRLLIGVFEKQSGLHIGFFMVEVDGVHRRATIHPAIGDKAWWGKGAVNECRAALLDYFFNERGIEKAFGVPPSNNAAAISTLKKQGWRHEGTLRGHLRSLTDASQARLDQDQYGLLREEWAALRNKQGSG